MRIHFFLFLQHGSQAYEDCVCSTSHSLHLWLLQAQQSSLLYIVVDPRDLDPAHFGSNLPGFGCLSYRLCNENRMFQISWRECSLSSSKNVTKWPKKQKNIRNPICVVFLLLNHLGNKMEALMGLRNATISFRNSKVLFQFPLFGGEGTTKSCICRSKG